MTQAAPLQDVVMILAGEKIYTLYIYLSFKASLGESCRIPSFVSQGSIEGGSPIVRIQYPPSSTVNSELPHAFTFSQFLSHKCHGLGCR